MRDERKHVRFDQLVELSNGQNEARLRIGFAGHGDAQDIIMAMPKRVIAFSEERVVLRFAQRCNVEAVRSRKAIAASEADHAARSSVAVASSILLSPEMSMFRSGVSFSRTRARRKSGPSKRLSRLRQH